MPDSRRIRCHNCGKLCDEVGEISWRGKCGTCGPLLAEQANDDLHYHRGPIFERWRRACAASVGGVLIDDVLREA